MFSKKLFNAKNLLGCLILFLILCGINAVSAQAAQTPKQAAEIFYKWYLNKLADGKNPVNQKQIVLKSVSRRLGKWIYSPAYKRFGADYFIDAQDFDKNWGKGFVVSNAEVKGNNAVLKVTLAVPNGVKSDFGRHTLAIKLVKENGAWKIDDINNRELTK